MTLQKDVYNQFYIETDLQSSMFGDGRFCPNGLHVIERFVFNEDSSGAQVTLPSSACMKQ